MLKYSDIIKVIAKETEESCYMEKAYPFSYNVNTVAKIFEVSLKQIEKDIKMSLSEQKRLLKGEKMLVTTNIK